MNGKDTLTQPPFNNKVATMASITTQSQGSMGCMHYSCMKGLEGWKATVDGQALVSQVNNKLITLKCQEVNDFL